jgi:hypothetical protein
MFYTFRKLHEFHLTLKVPKAKGKEKILKAPKEK